MKKWMIVGLAVAIVSVLSATAVFANHKLRGHWPSDNLSLQTKDLTTSALYDAARGGPADVTAALLEWNSFTPQGAPDFDEVTGNTTFEVSVEEGGDADSGWLGIASVRFFLDTKHVISGTVTMNTTLLDGADGFEASFPGATDHILCQELGHVLRLGHNRDGRKGGQPDITCMNDRGHLGQYPSPNEHDTEQLMKIYDHDDTAVSGPGGDEGGPDCDRNRRARQCRNESGWIVIHVFPAE